MLRGKSKSRSKDNKKKIISHKRANNYYDGVTISNLATNLLFYELKKESPDLINIIKIIKAGADLNAHDEEYSITAPSINEGNTPLHYAVLLDDSRLSIIRVLLNPSLVHSDAISADITMKNNLGLSPLEYMAQNNTKRNTKTIIDYFYENYYNSIKDFLKTSSKIAIKANNVNFIKNTILDSITRTKGGLDLKKLFDDISNPNIEIVKILIDSSVKIKDSSIDFVIEKTNLELFKYLDSEYEIIDRRITIRTGVYYYPIHKCITNKKKHDFINYIYVNGGNLNALDSKGKTPLHYAIASHHKSYSYNLIKIYNVRTDIADNINKLPRDYSPIFYDEIIDIIDKSRNDPTIDNRIIKLTFLGL